MMAGMRDYTDAELDLVRKSFGSRYVLRDCCYFETGRLSGKLAYRNGRRPMTWLALLCPALHAAAGRDYRQKLRQFVEQFAKPRVEIIRQLVTQAKLEDFPRSWHLAVGERRQEEHV